MRKTAVRPYGSTVRPLRLLSMLLAVAVLWMLFQSIRDPAAWRENGAEVPITAAASVPDSTPEIVVAGPNDRDEQEMQDAQQSFELVTDRTPLKPREMHAYWRLMSWSRTAPFADLKQRALHDVPFTRFWDQPTKYRGQLVTLRMHVRRVLEYDAPDNPQHLPTTYEAWGWTDESRSYPYVFVFSERPEGLPVGTDVRAEIEFVGYFLKNMSYTTFETTRGAPLLVGRVQLAPSRAAAKPVPVDPRTVLLLLIGAGLVIGVGCWWQMRTRRTGLRVMPDEPPNLLKPLPWPDEGLDAGGVPILHSGPDRAVLDLTTSCSLENVPTDSARD